MLKKNFNIDIGCSKRALVYLIIVHGVIVVLVVKLLSGFLLFFSISLLLIHFLYYCQCYQWLKNTVACVRVGIDEAEQWKLYFSNGSIQANLKLTHCIVTTHLVILYFAGALHWKEKAVFLFSDAVDAEQFRQLRVYLRTARTFQQE